MIWDCKFNTFIIFTQLKSTVLFIFHYLFAVYLFVIYCFCTFEHENNQKLWRHHRNGNTALHFIFGEGKIIARSRFKIAIGRLFRSLIVQGGIRRTIDRDWLASIFKYFILIEIALQSDIGDHDLRQADSQIFSRNFDHFISGVESSEKQDFLTSTFYKKHIMILMHFFSFFLA